MAELERIARRYLPFDRHRMERPFLSGEALSSGQDGLVLGPPSCSSLLFLAAQYESWSVPAAVDSLLPGGRVHRSLPRHLDSGAGNNVYFQIGLVMLVGLRPRTPS